MFEPSMYLTENIFSSGFPALAALGDFLPRWTAQILGSGITSSRSPPRSHTSVPESPRTASSLALPVFSSSGTVGIVTVSQRRSSGVSQRPILMPVSSG